MRQALFFRNEPRGWKTHCCAGMDAQANFVCSDHEDLWDCSHVFVYYSSTWNEYAIENLTRTDNGILDYCPYCGTKLPESRRGAWFDLAEPLGLTPLLGEVPKEYLGFNWLRLSPDPKIQQAEKIYAPIDRFEGQWHFLSNFYEHPFQWGDHVWASGEHAYQAAKCYKDEEIEAIRLAPTPAAAKKLGRRSSMLENWDEIRIDMMRDIVWAKFSQDEQLTSQLLGTFGADLIEGNWWKDHFWGVCRGVGENNLGKILMWARSRLRRGDYGAIEEVEDDE